MASQKPDIQPGVYRLTQEVDNPCPDGRKRGDWTAARTFKPGLFALTIQNWGYEDHPAWMISLKPLEGRHRWSLEDPERTAVIVPHLVREKTLASALLLAEREHYIDMRNVILRLVKNGAVSDPEVRLAVTEEALELEKNDED